MKKVFDVDYDKKTASDLSELERPKGFLCVAIILISSRSSSGNGQESSSSLKMNENLQRKEC